jgi:DNA polymerase III epsilon subunit-like protein
MFLPLSFSLLNEISTFGIKNDLKHGLHDYNDAFACIKLYQRLAILLHFQAIEKRGSVSNTSDI